MVCSRYFADGELPADLAVETISVLDFYHGLRFTKADRARLGALPPIERTFVWFVDRAGNVRWQRLLRSQGDTHWGAGDCNPPWLDKDEAAPWFATREAAEAR